MVLGLVVFIDLKSEESVPKFVEAFEPLVRSANHTEPLCLTYELHIASTNPRRLVVIERYADKAALTDVHEKTPAFTAFMSFVGENAADLEKVEKHESVDVATAFPSTADDGPWTPSGLTSDGVLVFCGARPGTKPEFVEQAALLGSLIAKRGAPLVYGGGTVGIMGAVARAVNAHGGAIKSVIPRSMKPREVSGDMLGTVYFTHTMGDRKSLMFDLSSTVIALPGGFGTFDELLETLTLYQLNAYKPKIGILNVCGFFTPFLALVEHLIENGFLEAKARHFFVVAETAEELFEKLDKFERPESPSLLQWTKKP